MKPTSPFVERLIAVIALAVLGAAVFANIYVEHGRLMTRERERLLTQSRVVAQHVQQTLESLNKLLVTAAPQPGSAGPASLDAYLGALTDGMPAVHTFAWVDAAGTVRASNRQELVGKSVANRSYFVQASQHPDAQLLQVSSPFVTLLGVRGMNVTRPLTGAGAQFRGLMTATLSPLHFAPLLDSVRYAPDMMVTLMHPSGARFVSAPAGHVAGAAISQSLLQQHLASGHDATVLISGSVLDNTARIIVQRSVSAPALYAGPPLVVEVDRPLSAVRAAWAEDAAMQAVMYALIVVLSLTALRIYQRKRDELAEKEAAAQRAIQASEHMLATVTRHLPALVAYWTAELHCRFANDAYLEWFGKSPQQMQGIHIRDLLGPDLYRKNAPYIQGVLRGETQHFERTLVKADGSTGYTWAQYIPDIEQDQVKGFFVLVSDVTPLKEAQMALADSELRLRTILDNEPESVLVLSSAGTVRQLNPAAIALIEAAADPAASVGLGIDQLVVERDRPAFLAVVAQASQGQSGEVMFEMAGLRGTPRWVECRAVALCDRAGQPIDSLCVMRDVTARKKAEDELERLARTDGLTGLSNRRHFMLAAGHEIQRTRRYRHPLSLLMIDIDHFKRINDCHGHQAGDLVLRRFADLCQGALRKIDLVGRLGGEEFAVMLPETSADQAMEVAEMLRRLVEQSTVAVTPDQVVRFTVSIGLTELTDDAPDVDHLLGAADKALYAAKTGGRNRICRAFSGLPTTH